MADLEHIPDPSPTPDVQVADMLDGQRAASVGLAAWAAVIARLPPEVADALAAEYRLAALLTGDEAARYRPSVSALAASVGLERRQLNRIIARAILDARRDAEAARAYGWPRPPAKGTGKRKGGHPRSPRGGEVRVTNAET